MSAKWEDTTTYAQNEKDRKPRCWSIQIGRRLRLVVLTGHVHFPKGTFVCHLFPLWETRELEAKDEASAKAAALRLASATIDEINAAWTEINR